MRPAAVMRREESSTSLVSTVIRGLGAFLERSQTVHWRLENIGEMTGTDASRVGEASARWLQSTSCRRIGPDRCCSSNRAQGKPDRGQLNVSGSLCRASYIRRISSAMGAGPADVGVLQAVFRHGGNSGKRYTLRFASTMNSTVPSLVLPDSIEGPLNNHDAGGSTAG